MLIMGSMTSQAHPVKRRPRIKV